MSNELVDEHISNLSSLITSKVKSNKKNEKKVKTSMGVSKKRTYLDDARISLKKDEVKLQKVKKYYSNSVPTKMSNKKIKLLDKIMHKS